jgi:DNA polymerase-3 subunit epsilon
MREIVIDTETTGLDPLGSYRIVEIGLINRSPTGQTLTRNAHSKKHLSN